MKRVEHTPPPRSAIPTFLALVVTNAGVLLVLVCGPNAPHPVPTLAYAGAAIALGGLFALLRSLIARRRGAPFPP